MPRRFFQRFSVRFPENEHPWYLKPFDYVIAHPVYWSSSRRSVCGGLWIGIFVGLLPIPGQTIVAVLTALLLRVNIPISAIFVWISNPLTFLPIFYLAYKIGAIVLNVPTEPFPSEIDMHWLAAQTASVIKPLFVGSILMGLSVSSVVYLLVSAIWHILTVKRYRKRHTRSVGSIRGGRPHDNRDKLPTDNANE